jgi:hypothetical protein
MVLLSHTADAQASAKQISGFGGRLKDFVAPGRDQLGAAHRFAQIAGRFAPAIVRLFLRHLVLIFSATPRHEKIPVYSNGIIRFGGTCSDQ